MVSKLKTASTEATGMAARPALACASRSAVLMAGYYPASRT
jgi:hypothetical protein